MFILFVWRRLKGYNGDKCNQEKESYHFIIDVLKNTVWSDWRLQ